MTIKRALAWAEAGWPVFPCRPNKKPWFADWPEVATTNRKTIEKWWEHDTGDYYVGVLPAAANPSCFVLDVDVKGKDGFASLQELSEKFGFQPADFPSQETPSGGRHIFMRGEYPTSALGADCLTERLVATYLRTVLRQFDRKNVQLLRRSLKAGAPKLRPTDTSR
jgi:hypothetical protein